MSLFQKTFQTAHEIFTDHRAKLCSLFVGSTMLFSGCTLTSPIKTVYVVEQLPAKETVVYGDVYGVRAGTYRNGYGYAPRHFGPPVTVIETPNTVIVQEPTVIHTVPSHRPPHHRPPQHFNGHPDHHGRRDNDRLGIHHGVRLGTKIIYRGKEGRVSNGKSGAGVDTPKGP